MSQSLSSAVIYQEMSDNKTNNDKATQTPPQRLHMPALKSFKFCSSILGLLVGFFIYLSTLGAEFVGVMLWGREILNKTNHELIGFSLVWNFITTMIAIIILSSMRHLVSIVFITTYNTATSMNNNNNRRHSANNNNDDDDENNSTAEDVLSELLSYMEGRFAVGALVGICLSWNITNLVLGMKPQIIQSFVILAVACVWCRVTLVLLGSPEQSLIYEDEEEEEEDEAKVALLNV